MEHQTRAEAVRDECHRSIPMSARNQQVRKALPGLLSPVDAHAPWMVYQLQPRCPNLMQQLNVQA